MRLERSREASAVDVLDRVLDKGVVIDYFARISVVGIDMGTIDARVVVASFDTYLQHAESIRRTGLIGGRMRPFTNSAAPALGAR